MAVIDVTEGDFQQQVIDRSRSTPVVVDFWASWCGPCRQLGPLLERAAAARDGRVLLAKVDTDANPRLAQAFQIRGIPAVKAFLDENVVSEFTGAKGRGEVESFFDGLSPSEADLLIARGGEEDLRRALELEPNRAQASVALARILIERGEGGQALALLDPIHGSFQADGLLARLRLDQEGLLADAFAALDQGELQRAFDLLLDAVTLENGHRDDIRRVIVGELDLLGAEHPLAHETRRRLASVLY